MFLSNDGNKRWTFSFILFSMFLLGKINRWKLNFSPFSLKQNLFHEIPGKSTLPWCLPAPEEHLYFQSNDGSEWFVTWVSGGRANTQVLQRALCHMGAGVDPSLPRAAGSHKHRTQGSMRRLSPGYPDLAGSPWALRKAHINLLSYHLKLLYSQMVVGVKKNELVSPTWRPLSQMKKSSASWL